MKINRKWERRILFRWNRFFYSIFWLLHLRSTYSLVFSHNIHSSNIIDKKDNNNNNKKTILFFPERKKNIHTKDLCLFRHSCFLFIYSISSLAPYHTRLLHWVENVVSTKPRRKTKKTINLASNVMQVDRRTNLPAILKPIRLCVCLCGTEFRGAKGKCAQKHMYKQQQIIPHRWLFPPLQFKRSTAKQRNTVDACKHMKLFLQSAKWKLQKQKIQRQKKNVHSLSLVTQIRKIRVRSDPMFMTYSVHWSHSIDTTLEYMHELGKYVWYESGDVRATKGGTIWQFHKQNRPKKKNHTQQFITQSLANHIFNIFFPFVFLFSIHHFFSLCWNRLRNYCYHLDNCVHSIWLKIQRPV